MGIKEKIMRIATGRTTLERKQEQAAMTEIRKEALAEGLRERRKHIIKLAAEKEKIKYEREIKRLKEPRQSFFGGMNYGSPFGQPRQLPTRTISKPKTRTIYVKKGKHYVKKQVRSKQRVSIQPTPQPQRYDILGNLGGRNNRERYRVI